MKKDETGKDRLMDALLREDARGGADDAFLAEVDKAIDAATEGGGHEAGRRGSARRWAWGIAAAACVGAVVGYEVFYRKTDDHGYGKTARDSPEMEAVAMSKRNEDRNAVLPAQPASELVKRGDVDPDVGKDALSALRSNLAVDPTHSARIMREESDAVKPAEDAALAIASIAPSPEPHPVTRPSPAKAPTGPVVYNGREDSYERDGIRDHQIRGRWKREAAPRNDDLDVGGGGIPTDFDRNRPPVDRERYGQLVDQPWHTPWQAPLSTFSVDVDTASYTNIRRMLRSGAAIPKDAVRIEECINYFDYNYPAPVNGGPFAVHVEMTSCPWQPKHHLVKIGLKGKEVGTNERPPSNLVFLIDVSGSMKSADKLPLLIDSMKILVEELDERDSVGIVVYAGSAGTVLEPTKVVGQGRTEILSALDNLRAGGSTAGAAGITGAYELAAKHYNKDGVNRVILATDGDFNVGTSGTGALVDLVKEKSGAGIFLSVLGFGTGNLNDEMMEAITNDGNGNFFYIDSQREGRKIFLQNLSGTLVTIAKDVKIQLEINPGKVAAYRLIGYANRILPPEAFNDDKIDAGDIGAGHTVTALYEVVPVGVEVPSISGVDPLKYQKPANRAAVDSPEWMTVKLRYKAPDGDKSSLIELPVKSEPQDWTRASGDFQFAAGVALFGEKLRGSDKIDDAAWEMVMDLAKRGSARDPHGHRAEFRELVNVAGRLPVQPKPVAPPVIEPALEAPKPQ